MTKQTKNVFAIVIDSVLIFLVMSIVNLLIVNIFDLSSINLLKQGIETSLYEQKMNIIGCVGLFYILIMIIYLVFFRKYFSVGNILLNKEKPPVKKAAKK